MAAKATKECPHCGVKVYWLKELKEWNEIYGDDWKGEVMISVMCRKCGEYAFGVDVYEVTKTETVKSPIGDVKIPKR